MDNKDAVAPAREERPKTPASKTVPLEDPQVKKGSVAAQDEDPEDYSDPICVCEPEPYWQEVAERLERESRAPK